MLCSAGSIAACRLTFGYSAKFRFYHLVSIMQAVRPANGLTSSLCRRRILNTTNISSSIKNFNVHTLYNIPNEHRKMQPVECFRDLGVQLRGLVILTVPEATVSACWTTLLMRRYANSWSPGDGDDVASPGQASD